MSVFSRTDFAEPDCAAHVWMGKPHWSHLHQVWENLIDRQDAPRALYQSPSYFNYLEAMAGPSTLDLLTLQQKSTEQVVGVAPVQKISLEIPFSIGAHMLSKARVPCLRVLGGEPMIPKTQEAHDRFFSLIARQYPDLPAVEMDAVSLDSFLWRYLFSSPMIHDTYLLHILHGVRDCYFVDLPPSIKEYHNRLGRKVRHNLEREERVLERHLCAPLTLTVLDRDDQVPTMVKALTALGASNSDNQQRLTAAVRHGFQYNLMLSAGDRIIGMTSGTKFNEIYRVHKILYDKALERYSPGTILWQRVLRFLIEDAAFKSVDLGYGTPAYSHRRINTIHKRGRVLLFRRTMNNRCLVGACSAFSTMVNVAKLSADYAYHHFPGIERQKPAAPLG